MRGQLGRVNGHHAPPLADERFGAETQAGRSHRSIKGNIMRNSILGLSAVLLSTTLAMPAFAQDEAASAFKFTGGATAVTDYRFRGLSQSDEEPAVQGTVNLNHESGFYVGVWASSIDGDTSLPGYGDAEVDLYGGYTKTLENGVGFDVGLLYYYYPDAIKGANTDFFEPYASISYTLGPVAAKLGANYAWGGQKGLDLTSGNDDNIYGYLNLSAAIPTTPLTVSAHAGYTDGSLGLYNLTANDNYWDWSVGVSGTAGPITVGVSYIDTDITNKFGFANGTGRDATVVGSIGFVF